MIIQTASYSSGFRQKKPLFLIRQESSDGSSHHSKCCIKEDHQSDRVGLDQISVHAQKISFHHPGYTHPNDTFLTLLALDHSSGGLHHLTALTACGIVARRLFFHIPQRPGNWRFARLRTQRPWLLLSSPTESVCRILTNSRCRPPY